MLQKWREKEEELGVGGIDSPESALAKIEAGASLIQMYTGLIFAHTHTHT